MTWLLDNDTIQTLLVIYGLSPLVLYLLLVGVGYLASITRVLINDPNRLQPNDYDPNRDMLSKPSYKVDTFGFFTELADGTAKVLEIGKQFYDVAMNAPGHTFKYRVDGRNSRNKDYKIVRTPDGMKDTHPIDPYDWWSWKTLVFGPYRLVWWGWQRTVFDQTGLVFTGIWPIVKVRTYTLEYYKDIASSDGAFTVRRFLDFSDEYRVFDFLFYVSIGSADTKDIVPIKIMLGKIFRITNPYRAAFQSDDSWAARIITRITSRVNDLTTTMPVLDVLGGSAGALTPLIWNAIKDLDQKGRPFHNIGVRYVGGEDSLTIPDRSLKNEEDERKFTAAAFATIERKAIVERGTGEAEVLTVKSKALRDAGPAGALVIATEAMVEAADKAGKGGGVVILGGDGGLAGMAALLKAFEKKDDK